MPTAFAHLWLALELGGGAWWSLVELGGAWWSLVVVVVLPCGNFSHFIVNDIIFSFSMSPCMRAVRCVQTSLEAAVAHLSSVDVMDDKYFLWSPHPGKRAHMREYATCLLAHPPLHSRTHTHTHSRTHTHTLTHSSTHSLLHSLTASLTHCFTHLLTRLFHVCR